jgi:uncharacterized protein (TIGR03790 family)
MLRGLRSVAAGLLLVGSVHAEGLSTARLGVLYNIDAPSSREVALYYAAQRAIPPANVLGIHLPDVDVISPEAFPPIRLQALEQLPTTVQSLLLVWSRPYAVGCMSVTSAFAAGYRSQFCPLRCTRTPISPLFDSDGWLPADTVGWWPAMLLPTDDEGLARALIQRGIAADAAGSPGTVYLVRTSDASRNVRAAGYAAAEMMLASRLRILELSTPVNREVSDAIGYFTGVAQVEELPRIHFRNGAVADHFTSKGGNLHGTSQMPAIAWLKQGATATYGTVSEPCNFVEKFPNPLVLFEHYTHGETALESYWKSVQMPGQGLFIGEPLSRPYGARHP